MIFFIYYFWLLFKSQYYYFSNLTIIISHGNVYFSIQLYLYIYLFFFFNGRKWPSPAWRTATDFKISSEGRFTKFSWPLLDLLSILKSNLKICSMCWYYFILIVLFQKRLQVKKSFLCIIYFEVRGWSRTGSVFRCCSWGQAAGEEESPGCDAAGWWLLSGS